LEEQLVEGQLVIRRKWGKRGLRSFLCFARGEVSSQLTALTGLSKKGGSIGAQIKATLRFLFIPALLLAGSCSRQAHIFIRRAYIF